MKEKKITSSFLKSSFLILIIVSNIGGLLYYFFKLLPLSLLFLGFLLIFVAVVVLVNREEISKSTKEKKIKKEEERKMNQKRLEEETENNIKNLRFHNMPSELNDAQLKKVMDFYDNTRKYLVKNYRVTDIRFPNLTNKEMYTLVFLNNESIDITMFADGNPVTLCIVNGKDFLNEEVLNNYKKEFVQEPSSHKKPTSNRVKRLRKQRKMSNNSTVVKNGKEYQPPNYDFIAKEWINENMKLLNMMANDDALKSMKKKNALITEDRLPKDKSVWKIIGVKLKADDEIDYFKIEPNGLRIFF